MAANPPQSSYVPDRGHIIWLQFNPQAGREQSGHRPALVLSPAAYNVKTKLCIVCPITSQVKGFPFEVVLPPGLKAGGAVLSDHVKSMDFTRREASFICEAPAQVVSEVLGKLGALLQLEP